MKSSQGELELFHLKAHWNKETSKQMPCFSLNVLLSTRGKILCQKMGMVNEEKLVFFSRSFVFQERAGQIEITNSWRKQSNDPGQSLNVSNKTTPVCKLSEIC